MSINLSVIKMIRVLRENILFVNIDDLFKREIISSFEEVNLKKGDIIDAKDTLDWVYIMIRGRIKASRINAETGQEYILFLHTTGDLFNIISIVDDKLPNVILESINDSILLRVEMQTFRSWIKKSPIFSQNFLLYTVRRLEQIRESASDLALHDTHTRLAKLILNNIDEDEMTKDNKYEVSLINDLSNDIIANMIGSARAVVSRNIQKMKADEIIEIPSRKEKNVIGLENLKECCEDALFNDSIK